MDPHEEGRIISEVDYGDNQIIHREVSYSFVGKDNGNSQLEEIKALEQELDQARCSGNTFGEAKICLRLGQKYLLNCNVEAAIKSYDTAYKIYQAGPDPIGMAKALSGLADVSMLMSQVQLAIEQLTQAYNLYAEINAKDRMANCLQNIAANLMMSGRFSDAFKLHQQCLKLFTELGDRLNQGRIQRDIGVFYRMMDKGDLCKDYFHQALATFTEVGSRSDEGITLILLGDLIYSSACYAEASRVYYLALLILRNLDEWNHHANAAFMLGRSYFQTMDYAKAKTFTEEALKLYSDNRSKEVEKAKVQLTKITQKLERKPWEFWK